MDKQGIKKEFCGEIECFRELASDGIVNNEITRVKLKYALIWLYKTEVVTYEEYLTLINIIDNIGGGNYEI